MRGSSQPLTTLSLHQAQQLALREHGVGNVQARELDLPRRVDPELLDEPVVERAMGLELEGADRVRDALDRVRLPVRPVVRRVDAPLVAGAVMMGVEDAVHDRVAKVGVARGHVDLGAQHPRAVRELAGAHPPQEVEALLRRAVTVGALAAGLVPGAAVLADLLHREVVDVGLAVDDQLLGPGVELRRNSRRRSSSRSSQSKPSQRTSRWIDLDVLGLLGGRVGVVEAQVARAAVLLRQSEVEADRLGVAEVQVAVGLRGEARADRARACPKRGRLRRCRR